MKQDKQTGKYFGMIGLFLFLLFGEVWSLVKRCNNLQINDLNPNRFEFLKCNYTIPLLNGFYNLKVLCSCLKLKSHFQPAKQVLPCIYTTHVLACVVKLMGDAPPLLQWDLRNTVLYI